MSPAIINARERFSASSQRAITCGDSAVILLGHAMPLIDMSVVVRLDSMSSRAELASVELHVASGVLPKLS
jgi:hypothetical protein